MHLYDKSISVFWIKFGWRFPRREALFWSQIFNICVLLLCRGWVSKIQWLLFILFIFLFLMSWKSFVDTKVLKSPMLDEILTDFTNVWNADEVYLTPFHMFVQDSSFLKITSQHSESIHDNIKIDCKERNQGLNNKMVQIHIISSQAYSFKAYKSQIQTLS